MTSRMLLIAVIVVLIGGICVWFALYPAPNDPKNIGYVLWKAGVYKLDLTTATAAMVGDPSRDELVNGKTKSQLEKRFGSLLSAADLPPALKQCYANSEWKKDNVLFIRESAWMIVLDDGKGKTLVLLKGC